MNAQTTYVIYDSSTNKPIHGTVSFNLDNCIYFAELYKRINPAGDYTVEDVTSDYFTKTVFNTAK